MRSIENRNRKIISGAEIDDTIFADFRENRPDTISDTSIVRSLVIMILKSKQMLIIERNENYDEHVN
jgi:hypothetical protein